MASTMFFLLPLLLSATAASAAASAASHPFNITLLLADKPDLNSFNDLLTQTGLADEINSRQTVTVLAVSNSAIDALSGRPVDVAKRILSVHVILDYYDTKKLRKVSKKMASLTTLFQASGEAGSQAGIINVTQVEDGIVSFGSAVTGAGLGSNLVKEVVTKPYDVSVLEISDVIVPPGIENIKPNAPAQSSPASATTTTATSPAASPSSFGKSKAPTDKKENAPAAEVESTEAPTAEGAEEASHGRKAAASGTKDADAPGATGDKATTPAGNSAAGRNVVGAVFAVAAAAAFLSAL